MPVPEQIRKQSEAVAKLYEELNPPSPDEIEGAQGEVASVEEPAADPAEGSVTTPPPNEQGAGGSEEATYEQRYRTLQGMYNSDTARLRAENQQLNDRLSSLENLLSSMGTSRTEETPAATNTRLVTDADVEEYGESIDVMRRVSREEASSYTSKLTELEQMIRDLQTSVVPKVAQVAHHQAASAEQNFWARLSSLVPDWRTTNEDPAFHEWLLTPDRLSGMTRQSYLENAHNNLDAERVATFFTTWKEQNGQAVAQPTRTASDELQRQVAPGKGRSGGAPAQTQNAKTYTPADIKQFFNDVKQGVYRGREEERDKIERDIFAAQGEGRIVMNG